jgi:hypothetical protein
MRSMLLAVLLLGGCGSNDGQDAQPGDEGGALPPAAVQPAPSQDQAAQNRQRAEQALGVILHDPESARYSEVQSGAGGSVCGRVDAKQADGRYGGSRPFVVTPEGVGVISSTAAIEFGNPEDVFPDFYGRCRNCRRSKSIRPCRKQRRRRSRRSRRRPLRRRPRRPRRSCRATMTAFPARYFATGATAHRAERGAKPRPRGAQPFERVVSVPAVSRSLEPDAPLVAPPPAMSEGRAVTAAPVAISPELPGTPWLWSPPCALDRRLLRQLSKLEWKSCPRSRQ